MVVSAMVEELQEQLLMWEEELTQREEALVKVSTNLDVEQAKTDATHQEYLDKMCTHTSCTKYTLSLDKMLGEKMVMLDGKDRDIAFHEAVLMEAQSRGLNPQDNCEELMEIVELPSRRSRWSASPRLGS
jgi:hypothetical protein